MRTQLKYITVAVILFAAVGKASAQKDELQMNIGYNVNIPSGDFRNYINKPAYKGFTAGLMYTVTSQLAVGLNIGYNDYYQKYPRQVYQTGADGAISAVVSNSVQQFPILAAANYSFLQPGSIIRPYVGAGFGVNFVSFDQYLGEFDDPHTNAKLDVKGEAGVYVSLSNYSSTAIKIGGSYNYTPYNMNGIKTLNSWGLEAGIRFAIH